MKYASYTKMTLTVILGSVIFIAGCSQDTSTSAVDTAANEEAEVSASAIAPTVYSDEPTIEITGKASYDILSLNNQVNSGDDRKVLAKTASSVLVDNLGLDGPFSDIAKKLLEQGENGVDAYLDKYSAGLWSITKSTMLD